MKICGGEGSFFATHYYVHYVCEICDFVQSKKCILHNPYSEDKGCNP